MTQKEFIGSFLREWRDEYAQYSAELEKFNNTCKIVRWFKGMEEPRHPLFHSIPLKRNFNVSIELRCYDGLFLACRYGDKATKINLQTGDKSPMLGAKGMLEPLDLACAMQTANFVKHIIDSL